MQGSLIVLKGSQHGAIVSQARQGLIDLSGGMLRGH